LTGTHDAAETREARQRAVPPEGRDVEIGAGAWIGTRALVLGPCRIGADAVVAAGSVVTRDVPDGGKVAGVPARPL
jgi:acetyltransferase-like isoleucine patch superfamily enzyme